MPFEKQTLTEIVERIEGDMSSRITNASSILRRSMLKILARVYGGAVYLLYGYIDFLKDQLFALSADAEYLVDIGSEYGITPKAASKASGEVSVTGTNGSVIAALTELQSSDGEIYLVDEEATIAGGVATLSVTAQSGGVDGNQDAGTVLTFVSPITGVNTSATVDSNALSGGLDAENTEELRERVLSRKRQPPHGGADFDYESWALEVSGVTRAWSFPEHQGIGTVGLAFVRDNDEDTIIPSPDQMEEVRQYIIEHNNPVTGLLVGIPVTAEPGFFVIDLTLQTIDFDIDISPNNSTTRSNVTTQLGDLIIEKGGPGMILYESDIISYAKKAAGLVAIRVNTPSGDTGVSAHHIPVLGDITFGEY